ncbi:MAG: phospholipase/carboxylesterase [Gammaproteobacteria bacterium]|nr:MAG: phospholipase/carboxylesterase [Gammaproteobacteria bacterium]
MTELATLEIESAANPDACVIWLHGLGADAHDFEGMVLKLKPYLESSIRYVFPNAPFMAVTINNGFVMRAWFDVIGLEANSETDETGIRESANILTGLIKREEERGIDASRIVLAGFSQGGVIALHTGLRYPKKLAGIMALSTWLPLSETLTAEASKANQQTHIFMAHGDNDPVVDIRLAKQTRDLLDSKDYAIAWHTYTMEHSVGTEEVKDIGNWLSDVLG